MINRDILISGASIAGPALAYWLRANGFNPTVVERAPTVRPGGQAVDLRGAGRTVVERMGLMEQVRSVTLDQRGVALVNADGRVTARMPADMFGGEGIVSEIEVLRGDLAQVFYDASAPTTEYVFDDTITRIDQDDSGVTVTFDKAAPRRFGLVVGADGLHSAVRRLAFGPETRYVRPLGCYISWFTAPDTFDLDRWYLMHNAPGGRVASIRPGRVPGEAKASLSFRSVPLTYDRGDQAGLMEIVAKRFADVGWHAPELVEAARSAPDFFFDTIGLVHMEHWSKGRAVVIGDAGYSPTPLTGLGTSLALVGAYVLAGELGAANGDHQVAFARYEQVIGPYVTEAQKLPPGGVKGYAPQTAAAISLRALSMRSMGRWPMKSIVAKQFAKAGNIALPNYDRAAV